MDSGMLSNKSEGVTIVELADSGVSILVLDSVSSAHEGLYSCVAIFTDGTMLNSSQAALNITLSSRKFIKPISYINACLIVC